MQVEVNWFAIILATLSTIAVGSVWYSKPVFGTAWMRLVKLDPKKAAKRGWIPIVITVCVSFLTAFVLAHVTYLSNSFFHNTFLQDALTTAFWMWLGFVAARFITHDAFENRPATLTVMNIVHELVTLLVMGVIIGFLRP